MSDPRDEVWERRADKTYSDLTYRPGRTVAKWFFGFLALCLAIGLLFGAINWIGSWGSTAAELTGPQHSKEQITAVLNDYTSLQAAAENVCDVEKAGSKTEEGDPTLIEDPAIAYKATYRRIEADYNRRMNNLFEAYVTKKLPLPGSIQNLPNPAPTLAEAKVQWCSVE